MALHFTREEFAERQRRACAAMAEAGLDGLLIFRQESMYYLTGYDTFGYVWFQCLYFGVDGRMTLLTRAPDLRQARHTSTIEDIRIWVDREGATPHEELRDLLDAHGCRGERLGVEFESYGLTGRSALRLVDTMDGFCTLADASDLVSRLRVVKSEAELAYVRRAAALADAALDRANELAGPGVDEGTILAAMHGAIYGGGGDDPANEFIIGSGDDALLCRYKSGRRALSAQDQLTLEFAGVYRHYHAAMMRTICIGEPPDEQRRMYDVAAESLAAARDALRPGRPIGEVFDAHAQVIDAAGMKEHRLNACGYSQGTTFGPNWMDWPMFYHGNSVVAEPGMVFFIHIIIFDSDKALAMSLGESVEVTAAGNDRLSHASLDLAVR